MIGRSLASTRSNLYVKQAYARMEEISDDMNASFKQQAAYQVQLEKKIDARFDKVDARFTEIDARFDKVDARFNEVDAHLDKMDARFNEIEAKMATKEDMLL
jgi:predicted nuclease with TOPRIM domain